MFSYTHALKRTRDSLLRFSALYSPQTTSIRSLGDRSERGNDARSERSVSRVLERIESQAKAPSDVNRSNIRRQEEALAFLQGVQARMEPSNGRRRRRRTLGEHSPSSARSTTRIRTLQHVARGTLRERRSLLVRSQSRRTRRLERRNRRRHSRRNDDHASTTTRHRKIIE